MKEDLRALFSNPEVYPVELTLTSGQIILIKHPHYVHYAELHGKIFFFPEETGWFEWISPDHIAGIRRKVKKSFWSHFFKGSKE